MPGIDVVATKSDETMDLDEAIGELRFEVGRFESVELSYPKGVNAVLGAVPGGDADLAELLDVLGPSPFRGLMSLYDLIGGVVLPDAGVGQFVHTPGQFLRELRGGGPQRLGSITGPDVFPFGSDGGGTLYVVNAEGEILALSPAEVSDGVYWGDTRRIERIAGCLPGFIRFLAGEVRAMMPTDGRC